MHQMTERRALPLLIAFADVHGFHRHAARTDDELLAEMVEAYYARVAEHVHAAGGTLVKYIGDSALIVFGDDRVDAGVVCLLALKDDIDAWLRKNAWASGALNVKAHYGVAVAGPYGPPPVRRFDVIGKAVNAAARLPSPGLAISPEAFRKLAKPTRARFKKHTPPVTYIRVEDPHRDA